MRRLAALLSVMIVVLFGGGVLTSHPGVLAQEATPAAESFMPEGITFETVAFAPGVALPATGDLSIARVSFESGTGFPIEAGDPTAALTVIESGELTIRQDGPFLVTRAGALDAAMSEEGEDGGSAPATEAIAAGQEVTLAAGDTAFLPPNVGGEVRNDGQERAVVLVVFVGPLMGEATPTP